WLNTRVMILGSNSELLSFDCCLKAGKRMKIAFSGFLLSLLITDLLNSDSELQMKYATNMTIRNVCDL
ncbi:MAG: hypothetical protein ACXVDN_12130, partial [Ktedonobacteraceae bacterium]